eukprot:581067-Alexandrium_andersonii.AAC.1
MTRGGRRPNAARVPAEALRLGPASTQGQLARILHQAEQAEAEEEREGGLSLIHISEPTRLALI